MCADLLTGARTEKGIGISNQALVTSSMSKLI